MDTSYDDMRHDKIADGYKSMVPRVIKGPRGSRGKEVVPNTQRFMPSRRNQKGTTTRTHR